MTLRIGMIGPGGMGQAHIERIHSVIAGGRVVAVTDLNAENARKVADRIGATTFPSAVDLIASDDVDAVMASIRTHLVGPARLIDIPADLAAPGEPARVVEQAVAAALESGQLAAYCADVLTDEPPRPDNPLFRQPNAYITPHIAWATREARQRLMAVCVENIRRFIAGNPQNVV